MATNLAIDDRLLDRAKHVGGFRTKRETVTAALEELIERREQRKILKHLGTFEFRSDWDYKQDRRGLRRERPAPVDLRHRLRPHRRTLRTRPSAASALVKSSQAEGTQGT